MRQAQEETVMILQKRESHKVPFKRVKPLKSIFSGQPYQSVNHSPGIQADGTTFAFSFDGL